MDLYIQATYRCSAKHPEPVKNPNLRISNEKIARMSQITSQILPIAANHSRLHPPQSPGESLQRGGAAGQIVTFLSAGGCSQHVCSVHLQEVSVTFSGFAITMPENSYSQSTTFQLIQGCWAPWFIAVPSHHLQNLFHISDIPC